MTSDTPVNPKLFQNPQALAGIALFSAAILGVVTANSAIVELYLFFQQLPLRVPLGPLALEKPLLLWVNDGLMALFFLLVGLELKREALDGELSSKEQITLPLAAAIGGIAVPALVFTAVNLGSSQNLQGWAIPAATDIAFALGILALFGSRAPLSLKVFLTALAIFDDVAAIAIIALFYTSELNLGALLVASLFLFSLTAMNKRGVSRLSPYLVVGALLWFAVLKSGVHATLAGVALGLLIPHHSLPGQRSPLTTLEHRLHPFTTFLVLPVFAFFNAGVNLSGLTFNTFADPLTFGIVFGLVVGKQVGVFGAAWLAIRVGLTRLPANLSYGNLYAVSALSGVGFTMSLFIGGLAFSTAEQMALVQIGVITGSLVAGVVAVIALHRTLPVRAKAKDAARGRKSLGPALCSS